MQEATARPLHRLGLLSAAALLLCWPAFFNGYPLLFPDAGSYLVSGRLIWGRLLRQSYPWFHADRSETYGAGIYLLHWGLSPWPIALGQACLVAWILWLVVRSLLPLLPERSYLVLVTFLSFFSGLAWYVSWPMPDILGPLVSLAALLLLCGQTTLARAEMSLAELAGVFLIGVWGITAHASHLVITAGLVSLLAMLWSVRWPPLKGRGAGVAWVIVMVAAAVLLPLAVHRRMYGEFSLSGARPPFLMARFTADGPAREYLRAHCPALKWTICGFQAMLDDSAVGFLWDPHGVWQSATPEQRLDLRREEMPLALATLRAYPLQQLRQSTRNFVQQLGHFRQENFVPADYAPEALARTFSPDAVRAYQSSRQGRARPMPRAFNRMLYLVVALSLGAILALIRRVWSDPRFQLLTVIVSFTVAFNAAVTGALSTVSWRYQGRVVWMVVLVALLMAARVWNGPPLNVTE